MSQNLWNYPTSGRNDDGDWARVQDYDKMLRRFFLVRKPFRLEVGHQYNLAYVTQVKGDVYPIPALENVTFKTIEGKKLVFTTLDNKIIKIPIKAFNDDGVSFAIQKKGQNNTENDSTSSTSTSSSTSNSSSSSTKPVKTKEASCKDILLGLGITSKKDFKKWSAKEGHPNKGGNLTTFQEISNCADEMEVQYGDDWDLNKKGGKRKTRKSRKSKRKTMRRRK